MSNISPDNKAIAQRIAKAFEGTPIVREYLHDNLPLKIAIASMVDKPDVDVTSYGTIGLSDTALKWGDGEFMTRIELCAAANSSISFFPNIVASAAFNIMRKKILCYPGSAMLNYVKEYYNDTQLPHLYFTSPFLWEDDLKSVELQTKTVSWLLCFPISQNEYNYLNENGDEKFETLLESSEVDIFDINRSSVC